jgi:phosphatidylglycerophosphatase C
MKKGVAFIDFDGTIFKKDSMILFLKLVFGSRKINLFLLKNLIYILMYSIHIYPNYKLKLKFIKAFFKGKNKDFFSTFQDDFLKIIEANLFSNFQSIIDFHKKNNHEIVILTASLSIYLEKWCLKNNFILIATELELKNGKFSGLFNGKNCHGVEKWNRIKEKINTYDLQNSYGYGDSKSDLFYIKHMKYKYLGNFSKKVTF